MDTYITTRETVPIYSYDLSQVRHIQEGKASLSPEERRQLEHSEEYGEENT